MHVEKRVWRWRRPGGRGIQVDPHPHGTELLNEENHIPCPTRVRSWRSNANRLNALIRKTKTVLRKAA